MFKKLRNKLLIVNTLIIAALLLGSFSVIYIITARNTNRDINDKLDHSINFALSNHNTRRDAAPVNNGATPPQIPEGERQPMPEGERQPSPEEDTRGARDKQFSPTFSVMTDREGNITKEEMPFELDDTFYKDKISGIISAEKVTGNIKSDSGIWRYKVRAYGDGYIAAFTEINAEQTTLRNLLIALLLVMTAAIIIAFLISLVNANRSIKPVEESYNKQKQFVADASHELKTPLATINTNVDVLMSHESSTIGEEKKWLNYIKAEAERMTKLTNDLLYLARLDHDENKVTESRVSFSEAAEGVLLLTEAMAFEKNINMEYDITPDLFVKGSVEQIKQVVLILVDNALKYTPAKGNIRVTLREKDNSAVLRVYNTGEGISEEAQKHIFERFYREDKSRARESGGYGLGLAIAHAIVTDHKGTISVESKKNDLTIFTVKLPLFKG